MFPLYQRMTCVNVTKSTFVSNRAVAGYSYFWGARHGREPIPVCDDCEDNVRKLLGNVISPTVHCNKHNYDDRIICQGATTFYQVPDVRCSNCSAVAPEVASSTLGVSKGGFPYSLRSGVTSARHEHQIIPYVQTVDYYDQLSPLDDTTSCSLRRMNDGNFTGSRILPNGAITKSNLVVVKPD